MNGVIPELEPVLMMAKAMPPLDFDDIAGLRRQGEAMPDGLLGLYVPDVDDVTTDVVVIDVADGRIELRVHRPNVAGPHPGLVWLHGGGWVVGTARTDDRSCRRRASVDGYVVVSVDYRLAPEYPFPIPLDDCYRALQWVVAHAHELDINPSDVTIAGQSAGGNLAAGVALL